MSESVAMLLIAPRLCFCACECVSGSAFIHDSNAIHCAGLSEDTVVVPLPVTLPGKWELADTDAVTAIETFTVSSAFWAFLGMVDVAQRDLDGLCVYASGRVDLPWTPTKSREPSGTSGVGVNKSAEGDPAVDIDHFRSHPQTPHFDDVCSHCIMYTKSIK